MTPHAIKMLYMLAVAEGEGMGTAYEYYVKRRLLRPWLRGLPANNRMLIAGLPEKYGSSLDFCLLAQELQADLVVADERPAAVRRSEKALAEVKRRGLITGQQPLSAHVADLPSLAGLEGARFDLILSSEVLQRLSQEGRAKYIGQLAALAPRIALFAPNADNPSHTTVSQLSGVALDELKELLAQLAEERGASHTPRADGRAGQRLTIHYRCGYLDLPPFPPGITRDEGQRRHAERGLLEALAMRGLEWYARLECYLPPQIKRRQAHIVYALIDNEL